MSQIQFQEACRARAMLHSCRVLLVFLVSGTQPPTLRRDSSIAVDPSGVGREWVGRVDDRNAANSMVEAAGNLEQNVSAASAVWSRQTVLPFGHDRRISCKCQVYIYFETLRARGISGNECVCADGHVGIVSWAVNKE